MDATTIAVMSIMFAAALVRGLSGFGNALVAMPLLALVIPLKVATPIVAFMAVGMTIYMLWRGWREAEFKSALWLVVSAAAGTPLGLIFLRGASEAIVKIALAVLMIAFVIYSLAHPRPRHIKGGLSTFIAGFSAGVLGGAYNTNGPPIVVYGTLRGWDPERFKATLQGFFLPAGVVIIAGHALAGLWTREALTFTLWSAPATVLGMVVSHFLSRWIPRERFKTVVHVLLLVCAALLAYKGVSLL